jgi:hypothetical protein
LADDRNEHAQPDASQASRTCRFPVSGSSWESLVIDEVWWANYLAQVTKSIIAAEEHLEVPAGTISSIPDDPDFIATVKMYAVVEPILNELIASRPPRGTFPWLAPSQSESENFRTFVTALNMEGRAGKLKLAEGMGLLTEERIAFVRAVAQVRNRYAHNVKNMHRSLVDIVTEEQRTNGRIVEHLTGIKLAGSPARNEFLKELMYYRLADYLSDALQTLRPPLPPEGGLLGMLGTPPPTIEK